MTPATPTTEKPKAKAAKAPTAKQAEAYARKTASLIAKVRSAATKIEKCRTDMGTLSQSRADALTTLHEMGVSDVDIGAELGVSRQAVHSLRTGKR